MASGVLRRPAWRRLQMRRGWRLFTTAIGFGSFGVCALLLSVSIFPLILLLPGRRKHVRTRRLLASIFQSYLRWLRFLGVLTYEFHNPLDLSKPGQLIIANHPSLLDALFLLGLAGSANCVVKEALWRNPFTALGVRAGGYISNARIDLVSFCTDSLRRGESIVIFPEGTRSRPGEPLRFHRAPFRVALAANAPVIPVVIKCEPAVLLKQQKWYDITPIPPHYSIRVGEKIAPADYLQSQVPQPKGPTLNAAARILTDELERYFETRRHRCAGEASADPNVC